MSEPVAQKVTVDPAQALAALDAVTNAEKAMMAATEKAAEAGKEAAAAAAEQAAKMADLKTELQNLIGEQIKFHQALVEGKSVTEEDIDAHSEREARIKAVANELAQKAAAEQAATAAVRQATAQVLASTQVEEKRADTIDEMRKELVDLNKVELDHANRLKEGRAISAEDRLEATRRQDRIKQITGELGKHEAAQRQATAAVKQSADTMSGAQSAAGGMSGMMAGMLTQLSGLAAGYMTLSAAASAFRSILQANREELEKNIQKTQEFAKAQIDLQFQSQTFNAADRPFVNEQAVRGGRSPVEVAKAYADLKSRFPQFDDQQAQALMGKVVESGMTTAAPLSALVEAFSTISLYEKDPQKAQNILRESIIQGGVSDPSKISPLFARFLPVGNEVAGLSTAQSAGAVAAATGLGLSPDEAITGLRNVALSISGKGTPEGTRVLKRGGVDRSDFFGALGQISQGVQSGSIKREDLESIAGREGVALLSTLSNPAMLRDYMTKVNKVVESGTGTNNITAEAIAGVMSDPITRTNFELEQRKMLREVQANSDLGAISGNKTKEEMLALMTQMGHSPFRKGVADWTFWGAQALGAAPQGAADIATYAVQSPLYFSGWVDQQPRNNGANLGMGQSQTIINNITNVNPINQVGDPLHTDSGRRQNGSE